MSPRDSASAANGGRSESRNHASQTLSRNIEKLLLHLTKDVGLANDRPSFLLDAQHHAREVMTPEIARDMIDYLTSRYATDLQVQRWLDNINIYVVGSVNPDGAMYVAAVCVVPSIISQVFRVPFRFGGTSIMIVVGVALDTVNQIEAQLVQRSYAGLTGPGGGRIRARQLPEG